MSQFIQILDPIECACDVKTKEQIKHLLGYSKVYYQQGAHHKIRKEYIAYPFRKGKDNLWYFYTGFYPRIKQFIEEKKLPISFSGGIPKIPYSAPNLPEITIRPEQLNLIQSALKKQRGVIQAPTGAGKTIIGIAICSAFKGAKILWLCHTKDLIHQTADQFKRFKFKTGIIGDGLCNMNNNITIATRQSFIKLLAEIPFYDIIIIDEAHHITSFSSEYMTILSQIPAPIRIGLTATPKTSQEAALVTEGLLGPIIDSISISEGTELGIISKPKIKILKIPKSYKITELRKYTDVYDIGIVENIVRNELILKTAKNHVDNNESVLILITKIKHGEALMELASIIKLSIVFVQGTTESEIRKNTILALNNKQTKCVIATVVFTEGVDIPELNVIINAAGGKSETRTLQSIGRGLRKTKTKSDVLIYDFFDPSHRYLIEHFGERLCLYIENNWL